MEDLELTSEEWAKLISSNHNKPLIKAKLLPMRKLYQTKVLIEFTLQHWDSSSPAQIANTAMTSVSQYPYCVQARVAEIVETKEIPVDKDGKVV